MYELAAFPTCPYVHRVQILCHEKGIPLNVRHVNLKEKPDWLLEISPRGKVPVLITKEGPLFESQAICEFIEESHVASPMLPTDVFLKAQCRAWMSFVSDELYPKAYQIQHAQDREAAESALSVFREKLDILGDRLANNCFLTGEHFGLVDIVAAPIFMRAEIFKAKGWLDILGMNEHVQEWSNRVLSRPSMKAVLPDDFADRICQQMVESWILSNPQ